MRAIVWLRRDLRLEDNKALYHACSENSQVLAVFFLTPDQWKKHNDAPAKIDFWRANLALLKDSLASINIPLRLIETQNFSTIPGQLLRIAQIYGCDRLYYNVEYEYNEQQRDAAVNNLLSPAGIKCNAYHDRILIEPGKVLSGSGKPYSVYTPFRKKWSEIILKTDFKPLPSPPKMRPFFIDGYSEQMNGANSPFLEKTCTEWAPGEKEAELRLQRFLNNSLNSYHENRDIPAIHGTSRLSPYLAAGVISIRKCFNLLLQSQQTQSGHLPDFSSSHGCWLNELIWREFYYHVMAAFPRVCKNLPFRLSTLKIPWQKNEAYLSAWQNGLTGYPIVDAGMRQLAKTGWMHNRLRMITAMFLSKNLLIDWRLGERWFMQNLIDGDFAANNGGWQWSASTGTDAAPYFRVFNPFSQSRRFDPEGIFIKTFCPELQDISTKALHDPQKLQQEIMTKKIPYPKMIVDPAASRKRAIEAFKLNE
ncbi:MAG: deoxyribodipyrimidine photo-lyase [Candidatus Rifleibacteriota bacterium]